MSVEFFSLDLVVARLKSETSILKKNIEGSVSLQATLQRGTIKNHSAFIIPGADSAQPNGMAGIVDQQVRTTFGVLIAVRNVADARGAAGNTALKPIRDEIGEALLNWDAIGNGNPITYGGGRLQSFANKVLWWQDNYVVPFNLRKV